MEQITVTLPAIDETVIANLDTLTTQASASEVEALKAIRETYSRLARQAGVVKIGATRRGDQNWSESRDYYYERGGRRIKGLLAYDYFQQPNTDQNSGRNTGDKLYLLETGEWLRIERDGQWSQWQGSANWWACGDGILDGDWPAASGSVRIVTDVEVEAEYDLGDIVSQIAKSLTTLAGKLPARMCQVQRRVALAAQLLAALKQG